MQFRQISDRRLRSIEETRRHVLVASSIGAAAPTCVELCCRGRVPEAWWLQRRIEREAEGSVRRPIDLPAPSIERAARRT